MKQFVFEMFPYWMKVERWGIYETVETLKGLDFHPLKFENFLMKTTNEMKSIGKCDFKELAMKFFQFFFQTCFREGAEEDGGTDC